MPASTEQKFDTALRVIDLLNTVEALLGGWVLQYDREWIERQLGPIYEKLDQEGGEARA